MLSLFVFLPFLVLIISSLLALAKGNINFTLVFIILLLTYAGIYLHARITAPKHMIEVIKFAKDNIPMKPSVLIYYYDLDKLINEVRQTFITTPLQINRAVNELYQKIIEETEEIYNFVKDFSVSISQISTSISEISKAFEEAVFGNLRELQDISRRNEEGINKGLKSLEENIGVFGAVESSFGEFLNELESINARFKNLFNITEELESIGRIMTVLSYTASLEATKYSKVKGISNLSNEIRNLANMSRENVSTVINNLRKLQNFISNNIKNAYDFSSEVNIIARRAEGIKDSFNVISQSIRKFNEKADAISRTIEEASSSITEINIAIQEMNESLQDIYNNIEYFHKTLKDLNVEMEKFVKYYSQGDRLERINMLTLSLMIYAFVRTGFPVVLLIIGFIFWFDREYLLSLLMFIGSIADIIDLLLIRFSAPSFVVNAIKGESEIANIVSFYVPFDDAVSYARQEFLHKPRNMIETISLVSASLHGKLSEISSSIRQFVIQISQMASSTAEISKAFEDILLPSVDELKSSASQSLENANKGYDYVSDNIRSFEGTLNNIKNIIENLRSVSEHSESLKNSSENVINILQKIKILSINATVETYKIQERTSFEVISKEIKLLSDKSGTIIGSMVDEINRIRTSMEKFTRSLVEWTDTISEASARAKDIYTIFSDMKVGAKDIYDLIDRVSQAIYESSSAITETASTLEHLDTSVQNMAEKLNDLENSIKEFSGRLRISENRETREEISEISLKEVWA